jgi:hypothetical protein
MTLAYQRFTTALLLIYGSPFLSGVYYCLSVFLCAIVRMSELELEQRTNMKFLVKLGKSGSEIRQMLVQVPPINFLFPKIKETLKGRHFDDTDGTRINTTALKAVSQNRFQNCFEWCTRSWHRCITSQRGYLEVIFSNEICSTLPRWVRELYYQTTYIFYL